MPNKWLLLVLRYSVGGILLGQRRSKKFLCFLAIFLKQLLLSKHRVREAMGKRIHSIVCIALSVSLHIEALRQRVVFVNKSTEAVLVTVDDEDIAPQLHHIVDSGAKRYFFPVLITPQRSWIIRLAGSSGQQKLTLELVGIRSGMSISHSCASYGKLLLKRQNEVIAEVPAPAPGSTIQLVYTPDLDLHFGDSHVALGYRRFSTRGPRRPIPLCRSRRCLHPQRIVNLDAGKSNDAVWRRDSIPFDTRQLAAARIAAVVPNTPFSG